MAERGVFGLEVGIEAHGDQGGHIERIAQRLAATADEGLPLPLAGLTAVRGKPCEASGLFSVQGADLGQEGEDQRCRDRPQAGDRAENLALACGGLILGNLPGDLGIQLCDLTINRKCPVVPL